MGVPVNNPSSNRENCPKISTACVIWQGPDIPCIDLCAGDAIDEVVFKLATYLCELSQNIFNIENIEFSCLLPPDSTNDDVPTNLEELIQLIINNVCNENFTPLFAAKTVGITSSSEPIIELPDGIAYFDENGDYITVLEQSKYVKVVATKLAETIVSINSIQGKIFNAEKAIKNLQNSVKKLEANSSTSDIYVVSQCASSSNPGQQVLIQDAFTVFERNYCNLTSVIGTTTALYNGINSQIPNLSNLPQLMNGSLQMKAIPKWSTSVNNIGNSITNLWLTVTDMRNKIIEIANVTYDVPCILLSPENMTMGTIGEYTAEVYWEKPSVESVQMPTSYSIQVFALDDKEFKNPLYSQTQSEISGKANVINISSQNIEADVEYVIHISSIYKCGMSKPSSLISKLLTATIYFEVVASITEFETIPSICNTTAYDMIKKQINFTLLNIATRTPVPNDKTKPITIIARFNIDSCDFSETVYEDVTFEIQPGEYVSNNHVFISEKLTNCIDGSCGPSVQSLSCGVFVSEPMAQFDSKYGSCN